MIVSAGMAMNADPGADTEYAASDPSVADHAAFQGRAQFDAVSVRPSVHDVASCFSKADWDGGGRIYSAPLPRPIRYGEGAFLLVDVILAVRASDDSFYGESLAFGSLAAWSREAQTCLPSEVGVERSSGVP